MERTLSTGEAQWVQTGEQITGLMKREEEEIKIDHLLIQEFQDKAEVQTPIFVIPEKFKHVDLEKVHHAEGDLDQLRAILKSVHPWSALHYGMSALDVVLRLYTRTIPGHFESQFIPPKRGQS